MKQKSLLRLTYTNAKEKIYLLGSRVANHYHIDYKTRTTDPGDNACIIETDNILTELQVNIPDLTARQHPLQKYIPDQQFVTAICAIHHEAAHCYRATVTYQQAEPTQNDIDLTINHISKIGNPYYYLQNGNYFINPNEIDAEYHGIKWTYQYLKNEFPNLTDRDCENLTLDYVNHCIADFSYWIPSDHGKPYASLDTVYQSFQHAYNHSKTAQRWYFCGAYRHTHDEAMNFMLEPKHRFFFDTFLDHPHGIPQDKAIASIVCLLHPECQNHYKTLQHLDLSTEAVWGISVEKPNLSHRKVPEHMERLYRESQIEQQTQNIPSIDSP